MPEVTVLRVVHVVTVWCVVQVSSRLSWRLLKWSCKVQVFIQIAFHFTCSLLDGQLDFYRLTELFPDNFSVRAVDLVEIFDLKIIVDGHFLFVLHDAIELEPFGLQCPHVFVFLVVTVQVVELDASSSKLV